MSRTHSLCGARLLAWRASLAVALLAGLGSGLGSSLGCGGRDESPMDAGLDTGADALADGARDGSAPDTGAATEPCDERAARATPPEVFVGPDGLAARLVAFMEMANETLRVATYELDDTRILGGLEAAHGRGVAVRVLVDESRDANTAAVARLRAAGIDVRDGPDAFRFYHPKVLISDEASAIVMSANLNSYSMETERNHGTVLSDAFDIADLIEVFDHDYEGRSGDPIAASCTRLVLSPHNARSRILRLIASAEETLRVQQLLLSDDEVRAAIIQRATAGVSTQVILADPAWIESNTESATALTRMGVEVRILSAPENHAKLIIADNAALVGSENMSWTSLERNREVGLVITDEGPVSTLRAAFDGDWAASRAF